MWLHQNLTDTQRRQAGSLRSMKRRRNGKGKVERVFRAVVRILIYCLDESMYVLELLHFIEQSNSIQLAMSYRRLIVESRSRACM